jgi:hypothetical protein
MLNAEQKAKELLNYLEKLKTNNMAQQTAVEWFVQQLEEYGSDDFKITFKKQFEQAKAMEKDQIRMAFTDGKWSNTFANATSEQYYNENYKK